MFCSSLSACNKTAFATNISSFSGTACLGTGSTHTLLRLSDAINLSPAFPTPDISVRLPNGTLIASISTNLLHLPNLPQSKIAYVFADNDLDASLISISNLCNLGCTATFTDTHCHIPYEDNNVLSTAKLASANLWHIPLPLPHAPMLRPAANATILLSSDRNFVAFAHAALGSPTLSTFLRAVKFGYLHHWPRLTTNLILAHPPHTIATAQGHLNQQRQGVDSTAVHLTIDDTPCDSPLIPATAAEANHVYVRIQRLPHQLSSDLTGRFPVPSITGAQYVLVTECEGYIHVEAMASRTHTEYVRAFKNIVKFFTALGRKPFYQRLDNETSAPLEAFFKRENVSIQYCPPGQHRTNRAERSIQTFKNHAISIRLSPSRCGTRYCHRWSYASIT